MLRLEEFGCGYGDFQAVRGLDLDVAAASVTALLGANGAGKSSTILCIAGHVALQSGRIWLDGEDLGAVPCRRRVEHGVALAPEGRRMFPDLSVAETLVIGGFSRPQARFRANRDRVLALFPRLAERLDQRAGALSGGEQQMLAIGRALMAEPRLLMIDELSLGLMPKVVDQCFAAIRTLRADGVAILLVEQNTTKALQAADQVCVLESGRPVWRGSAEQARGDPGLIEAYLGLRQDPKQDPTNESPA